MKLLIKHFSVLILLLFIPGISQANFCHKDTTDRAKEEAGQIKFEDFAKSFPGETVDYLGQRSYNADIISCNRKRDNKSGDIEGAISAKHKFPDNLESRTVKGHYNYYSTAPLRYAYEIRRENGEWIITIPMRFHWPTSRKTDMIDISMELVNELSDANLNRICDPVNRVMDNNGNTVKVGRIPHEGTTDTNNVANKDTHFDGPACRVRRTLDVNGTNIRRHLRHFYANSLKRVWDRPGFIIEPLLLDHGEGTSNKIEAWEKDKTVWDLRLNLKPDHRTSYKRWAFKWNNMYTGVPAHVIGHEFGHLLGLDDEYGWGPSQNRACATVNASAPANYIMCNQAASIENDPQSNADQHNGAKAVYAWIVTRRYAAAKENWCNEDSDCADGYCEKSGLDRNSCRDTQPEGKSCSRDGQCNSGLICQKKPVGMCYPEGSQSVTEWCYSDKHCKSGSCTRKYGCQCKSKEDCGANQYCDTGTVSLGRNQCQSYKAIGDTCSADKQCNPPASCAGFPPKRCVVSDTKSIGTACWKDVECKSGNCEGGHCVCTDDKHCSAGQECKKPLGGQNYCTADRGLGVSCNKNKECSSGKCEKNECVCKKDSDCPGKKKCKTPVTKKNYCA